MASLRVGWKFSTSSTGAVSVGLYGIKFESLGLHRMPFHAFKFLQATNVTFVVPSLNYQPDRFLMENIVFLNTKDFHTTFQKLGHKFRALVCFSSCSELHSYMQSMHPHPYFGSLLFHLHCQVKDSVHYLPSLSYNWEIWASRIINLIPVDSCIKVGDFKLSVFIGHHQYISVASLPSITGKVSKVKIK